MSDGDWRDPFDDDEAARERARRRAEREERRRARRRELSDRVREETAKAPPPAGGSPKRPPAAGSPGQPPAEDRPPPPATPSEPPPTGERPGEAGTPGESRPAPGHPPAPETGEGPEIRAETGERPAAPETGEEPGLSSETGDRPARAGRAGARRGGGPRETILRRRLAAIGLLAAGVGLVFFGASTVADRIGGSNGAEDAGAPAEEEALISVTIPEGLDRRQVGSIARDAGLRGNYAKASRNAKGFNPGRFGADNPDSLEGFLFPATYELPEEANVKALIRRQLDTFRDQIEQVNMREARSRNLTVYDVLKIASMIEREVQVPKERRLVASVIYNRLEAENPLGVDATIRYEDGNFDEPLTESRLAEPTPYNTRVNAGLPPTPIGNPGQETIQAAANPADTDHFYYVVKPNTCGEHFFTASEEEFNNAAAEYQQALDEQGGAPTPDDC